MKVGATRVLLEGLGVGEGPVVLPDGRRACCSIPEGAVFVLAGEPDRESRRIGTGGGANGLAVGPDGLLYLAQNGGIFGAAAAPAGVQRIDLETGSVEYLVSGLGAPNDVCFGPDGLLYFTDSRGESDPTEPGSPEPGRLYRCAADGERLELLVEGPRFINGLAFDPAGTSLIVAETARRRLLRYEWSDAGLGEPVVFAELADGYPDGFAFDSEGRLWVAATYDESIQAFDRDGALLERIPLGSGHVPTNCCLAPAGEPGRLYVATAGSGVLLEIEVEAAAQALFPFR
jgi:gluconolactonase